MNSALQDKTVGALSQILSKGVVRHAEQRIGRVNFRATGSEAGHVDRPDLVYAAAIISTNWANQPQWLRRR
jgi:hypothetical protein